MVAVASRPWTDEDLGVVTDNPQMTSKELGETLGRTCSSVANIRFRISKGWRPYRSFWSDAEDCILIEFHMFATMNMLAEKLPGRTPESIRWRLRKLGISPGPRPILDPHVIGARTVIAKTCSKCGELLAGSNFLRMTRASRKSGVIRHSFTAPACNRCNANKSVAWQRENPERAWDNDASRSRARMRYRNLQLATLPTASRNGYDYTDSDLEVLADNSISALGKALRLNRSYVAVLSAMDRAGVRPQRPLGIDDAAWSIDNPNLANIDEITAMLKQEFQDAGIQFPEWDWDDEDLKESA